MSFLYPRTVSLARPPALAGVGFQPSAGVPQETPIASSLPASIQAQREGQRDPVGVPTDGTRPMWRVFIPLRALAKGSVDDRDVVIDDEGERYQVVAAYWDSLGHRLHCERLEA